LEALLEETNHLAALRRGSKKKLRAIFRACVERMKARERAKAEGREAPGDVTGEPGKRPDNRG
jgi:hypothetical protein